VPTDTWTLWGPVYDSEAVLGVIKALQNDGHRVRAVKVANHTDIYINDLDPEAA
jgi:hypothetical protein